MIFSLCIFTVSLYQYNCCLCCNIPHKSLQVNKYYSLEFCCCFKIKIKNSSTINRPTNQIVGYGSSAAQPAKWSVVTSVWCVAATHHTDVMKISFLDPKLKRWWCFSFWRKKKHFTLIPVNITPPRLSNDSLRKRTDKPATGFGNIYNASKFFWWLLKVVNNEYFFWRLLIWITMLLFHLVINSLKSDEQPSLICLNWMLVVLRFLNTGWQRCWVFYHLSFEFDIAYQRVPNADQ